jgi:hypothetical protein
VSTAEGVPGVAEEVESSWTVRGTSSAGSALSQDGSAQRAAPVTTAPTAMEEGTMRIGHLGNVGIPSDVPDQPLICKFNFSLSFSGTRTNAFEISSGSTHDAADGRLPANNDVLRSGTRTDQ